MRSKGLLGVVVITLVYACPAPAYKAMTHKAITNHMASRTVLSNEELMTGMGFDVVVPEDVNSLLKINEKGIDECDFVLRDKNIKHLTDFFSECGDPNDPDNKVIYCIQHFEYMGKERLVGWADLRSESLADYHNGTLLHLSANGGVSWSHTIDAPFDLTCEALPIWEGRVEKLIYLGKSHDDRDIMMALTRCQEVSEDTSSSSQRVNWGPVIGRSLFFTRDGGENWTKVNMPEGFNYESELLYMGDNGAIPGLYYPEY
jgi:hypothetical protein